MFSLYGITVSWADNPTVSDATAISLSDIPFPVVSLCHQGNLVFAVIYQTI